LLASDSSVLGLDERTRALDRASKHVLDRSRNRRECARDRRSLGALVLD
jgi:hypothetical protein